MSLDALEERYPPNVRHEKPDQYFGLLMNVEDERIYGYCTNTKIKFIVIAKDVVPETTIRTFLRATHSLYVAAVCNPFSPIGGMIDVPSFTQGIIRLFQDLNIGKISTVGLESVLAPSAVVSTIPEQLMGSSSSGTGKEDKESAGASLSAGQGAPHHVHSHSLSMASTTAGGHLTNPQSQVTSRRE